MLMIVIIGKTHQEVMTTNDLIRATNSMWVNRKKTKYLFMTRGTIDYLDLVVGNYSLQQLDNFKYLGANINN